MTTSHTATTSINSDSYATIAPDISPAGSDLAYDVGLSSTHVEETLGSGVTHDGKSIDNEPWLRFLDEQVENPWMDSKHIAGLNAMG